MKKLTALVLALLMAASLSLIVSANSDGNKWGDIPLYNGEIKLDGEIDPIYFDGLVIDIKDRRDAGKGATGTAYFLWGNNKLYVAVDVTDADIVPVNPAVNTYKNESIEFVLDFLNKGDSKNAGKIMLSAEDNRLEYRYEAKEGCVKTACTMNDDGYIFEVIYDLSTQTFAAPKAGVNYGIVLTLNDIQGKDTRTNTYSPSKNGAGTNDVAKYDYVTLSGTEVKLVEAPAKTDAPAASVKAPATADMGILAVIALAAAFGGAAVSGKRK